MIYHKTLLADTLTPVSAFIQIAEKAENAFLLESVEGGANISRYSFLGVNPESSYQGTFRLLRQSFQELEPQHPDLPPFTGGAVGIFSYEMIRELEKLPDSGMGDEGFHPRHSVMLDYYSTVLAFDHVKNQIVIMSHESQARVDELVTKLTSKSRFSAAQNPGEIKEIKIKSNTTRHDFIKSVATAKDYIRAGDIFQVVLSQRFEATYKDDPFKVYRALRHINPSPYLYFIKQGETYVAGASPEKLVSSMGGKLEYRPIAGTRKRGKDAAEELRMEEELLSDEKERAEHIMLVDLGRNDLGKVSKYGSVQVQELMKLEKYSHVMHMVSKLKGELQDDLNCFDALAACFPAGTVTGAPKIRAMEIIEELEPCRRGIYAGAIGYIDFSGNLDTCITIRTIVMNSGKAYIQAGAGIVADSVPELEYKECQNKAMGLVKALELASNL